MPLLDKEYQGSQTVLRKLLLRLREWEQRLTGFTASSNDKVSSEYTASHIKWSENVVL